jgi:hypothetical protein
MRNIVIAGLMAFLLQPAAGFADKTSDALKSFIPLNIRPWISDPIIINALKRQNKKTDAYDQATIDQLDLDWRALVDVGLDPMIRQVVTGDVADFLRGKNVSSGGAIIEIILMDAKGLNVAATKPPSDFWQGDEPKFMNSFGAGADGIDFGEVEYDDSTGAYLAQVSLPIADPETGTLIGAITLGVKVSSLD